MRLAGSDWGFDKMWCGAATTYNAEGRDEQAAPAPPCAIVPLAVWADREGRLSQSGNSESSESLGGVRRAWARSASPKLLEWGAASQSWRAAFGRSTSGCFSEHLRLEHLLRLHTLQDLDAERFRKHVSAAAASSTEQPLNRTLEIQKCVGLKKRKLCEYRVRQRLRTLRTVDPVGLQDQGKKGGGLGHGGTSSCRVMAQRWLHVDRKEDVFRY